jgi:hypothetical protein
MKKVQFTTKKNTFTTLLSFCVSGKKDLKIGLGFATVYPCSYPILGLPSEPNEPGRSSSISTWKSVRSDPGNTGELLVINKKGDT